MGDYQIYPMGPFHSSGTLPETRVFCLKIGHPKGKFLSGAMLVSGRGMQRIFDLKNPSRHLLDARLEGLSDLLYKVDIELISLIPCQKTLAPDTCWIHGCKSQKLLSHLQGRFVQVYWDEMSHQKT